MADTDTLAADVHAQYAWLVLVDGSPYAFASHRALEDRIDFVGTGVDVRAYLSPSDCSPLPTEVDIRTGNFDNVSATLVLDDHSPDGLLASLFASRDDTETVLAQTIEPGEDLSSRTELHGMHVGTEAIGSGGERRQYPAFRNCTWGMLHVGRDAELPDVTPAPLSASPVLWRGRWVAVYQCFRDHITYPDQTVLASWRPFSEARLRWWGTSSDAGRVDGRRWSLECEGPESLLRRDLGMLTQQTSAKVLDVITLNDTDGEADNRIAVQFYDDTFDLANGDLDRETFGTHTDFSTTLTSDTAAGIIDDISAVVASVALDVGVDGVFSGTFGHLAAVDNTTAEISIRVEEEGPAVPGTLVRNAVLAICMSARRWSDIGYDVTVEEGNGGPVVRGQNELPKDDPLFVSFHPYPDGNPQPAGTFGSTPDFSVPPGDDYVIGYFYTKPFLPEVDPFDGTFWDHNGQPRVWRPKTTGPKAVLRADLNGGRGQVVDLGEGIEIGVQYHRGQLDRPPASDPDDAGSPYTIPATAGGVNRQGIWLFYGKRIFQGQKDPFDEYWVGRCSWRNGSGFQSGQVNANRLVVSEWLLPRQWGYDRPKPSGQWIALSSGGEEFTIRATPLLHLGYQTGGHLSRSDFVLDRLLRSTGTSTGWWTNPPTNSNRAYSDSPLATLDPGDNESALPFGVRRDGEDADLGLGIPDEILAGSVALATEFASLPGDELGMTKVSIRPGENSEDVFDQIKRPLGWCWSLRGGAYGVFTIFDAIPIDGFDMSLDQSSKVGGRTSEQDLRAFAPIDRFELEYNRSALDGKYRQTFSFSSPDKGKRYRPGGIADKIKAMGMTTATGFRERMAEAARWWERRHFFLDSWAVMPEDRAAVWVGDRVRITEPRAVSPGGSYGLTAGAGIVVGTSLSLADGVTTTKVFVHESRNGFPRVHAVSAQGIGYDTATNELYVADNWLAVPTDGVYSDAAYFVEPGFVGLAPIGGNAQISAFQWDGVSWSLNLTATVDSVVTTPGSSRLVLSGVSGTYRYAADTVVVFRSLGGQTAQWVLELYGITCDKDAQTSATDGYQWEP